MTPGKVEVRMRPDVLDHLRREWPLVLVALLLVIYLPVTLYTGVFYTNQGNILRSVDPERYWSWIRRFALLLAACLVVIIGSYFLS